MITQSIKQSLDNIKFVDVSVYLLVFILISPFATYSAGSSDGTTFERQFSSLPPGHETPHPCGLYQRRQQRGHEERVLFSAHQQVQIYVQY
jgi:hypothetical protein